MPFCAGAAVFAIARPLWNIRSEKMFLAKPKIIPAPKSAKWGEGFLPWQKAAFDISREGLPSGDFVFVDAASGEVARAQGYKLSVCERGIFIAARDLAGARNALQTLRQMALQAGENGLRFVEIEDYPDLEVRGFMLDISRCKVPTMRELGLLVDRLALLKFNRLELYTEHTFAFEGHEIVWADASPMTAEQYRNLDEMCAFAGIELVANINGLGHMERWLRYPKYRHLAESEAPFVDPLGNARKFPTTLYPDENAAAFMDSLYAQFLPNFSSDKINIGGDEPWELGMGRSKPLCATPEGKYRLYIKHVARLAELAAVRGKGGVYFWADVLMRKPEFSKILPENMTPVLWGYYLDHPYEEQCAYMSGLGRDFLVAPGTSTWNSFGSRWDCAFENISVACKCAKKYGAKGMVLTQWGDGGNHQPFCAMFPAVAAAAACAWGEVPTEEFVCDALSKNIFGDATGEFARAICALGRCDVSDKLFSLHHRMFFADAQKAQRLAAEFAGVADYDKLSASVDFAASLAGCAKLSCGDAQACMDEFALACQMIKWGFEKAKGDFASESDAQQVALKFIAAEYERVWLLRARLGGLAESAGKIRAVKPELFETAFFQ